MICSQGYLSEVTSTCSIISSYSSKTRTVSVYVFCGVSLSKTDFYSKIMQQRSSICRNGSRTFLKKRRKPYPLMVEKKQSCERVEKDEESNNSESDSTESSFHEQNLYIASFPLLASFALINYLSYLLFVLFRFLWQHIIQLRGLLRPISRLTLTKNRESNLDVSIQVDMAQTTTENPLVKQKYHHRKAFEYITRALEIDEENEGMNDGLKTIFRELHILSVCFILQEIRIKPLHCTRKASLNLIKAFQSIVQDTMARHGIKPKGLKKRWEPIWKWLEIAWISWVFKFIKFLRKNKM